MKKHFTHLFLLALFASAGLHAQTYNPVGVTGMNLDGIAESIPATSSTSGALDGSDYVLYSAAYGAAAGTSYGLPNNGTIVNGGRTYQLNSYNQNNLLYITAGLTDSMIVTTPAYFAGVSLLGFATEASGGGTMDVTLRFTDNTSVTYSNKSIADWFSYNGVINGLDRTGRLTDNPDYNSSSPSMYALDLNLACANQTKLLAKVVVHNTGSNARLCLFALSGAAVATYSTTSANITCSGAHNGTAGLIPSDGVTPFTYSWSTAQTTSTIGGLSAGNYTVTAHDVTNCSSTFTFAITEPAPGTLTVTASSPTVCSNSPITFTATGANTYTWSNTATGNVISVSPISNAVLNVTGTTLAGCAETGSIAISVTPPPAISFTVTPGTVCNNSPTIALSASPAGGTFSGPGVTGSSFSPSAAGQGNYTLDYTYTGSNGCTGTKGSAVNVTFCTGIDELENASFAIYPNPSNGVVTLRLDHAESGTLNIYDNMGKLVLQQAFSMEETTVNISTLSQGIYHYILSSSNGIMGHGKLIRQ